MLQIGKENPNCILDYNETVNSLSDACIATYLLTIPIKVTFAKEVFQNNHI